MTRCSARSLSAVLTATLVVGFAVSLVGCASLSPLKPVAVSDIKSVAGHWAGKVYRSSEATPESVGLTIREDGSFHIESRETIGASHGNGKIVIRDGRLIMQGDDSSRGIGTLHTSADGDRVLYIEATLSDNRIVSGKLSPSR